MNAIEESNIHIDEFADVQRELPEILKKLRVILPIKFETKTISIRIPAVYAHKTYGVLKGFGQPKGEQWGSDGSLTVALDIPGGLEQDFYDKINGACHGNAECRVIATH